MKLILLMLLSISSTSLAALPPHFEQARIISFVVNEGASLFPFDPIVSIVDTGKNIFKLTSAKKCVADVEVVFDELQDGVIGPNPLKELLVIAKGCEL